VPHTGDLHRRAQHLAARLCDEDVQLSV
jgi:hypothetical protein